MISYIKGKVAYTEPDFVVVDVNGIGYQIRTSSSNISKVSSGKEVMFFTYLYVREDTMALYGFLTKEELNTFQTLLGVSGVGPKVAVAVLSTMTVKDLYYAVLSDDAKAITKTPGLGPKGAKKMILELKDKFHLEDLLEDASTDDVIAASNTSIDSLNSVSDTIEALTALGYSNGEAYRAVHSIAGAEEMDSEQLLKQALNKLLTL